MKKALYTITSFYPHYYNVHILINGNYAGVGRFCQTFDEMIAFCKYHNVDIIEKMED